jgi:hypothetical protein
LNDVDATVERVSDPPLDAMRRLMKPSGAGDPSTLRDQGRTGARPWPGAPAHGPRPRLEFAIDEHEVRQTELEADSCAVGMMFCPIGASHDRVGMCIWLEQLR